MTTYNHAYDIAFCLESKNETGEVSGAELRKAILKKVRELSDAEIEENAGMPFDSYEVEKQK